MQMSQFQSFGKFVLTLCLPDTTFPRGPEADEKSSRVRPYEVEHFHPPDFP